MVETRQLCTFRLDYLCFGVDVRDVQGVVSHQPLTRVPLAPPAVRGLMNLRGEVIASIDLRPCLELDTGKGGGTGVNVILRGSSGPVSLLVDEIADVTAVTDEHLEPPLETLPGVIRAIIENVCQVDGRLILLLDVEQAIQSASGLETEFLVRDQ